MPGATAKGVPYSQGADAASTIDTTMQALAEWIDARPGLSALTTVQRDALAGADLWDGRVIWNKTTARLERFNTGTATWIAAMAAPDLSNVDAQTLDGLDSTDFALAGATAAALAGKLGTGAKAADSELLDGLDSTAFALAARPGQSVGFAEMFIHGGY